MRGDPPYGICKYGRCFLPEIVFLVVLVIVEAWDGQYLLDAQQVLALALGLPGRPLQLGKKCRSAAGSQLFGAVRRGVAAAGSVDATRLVREAVNHRAS